MFNSERFLRVLVTILLAISLVEPDGPYQNVFDSAFGHVLRLTCPVKQQWLLESGIHTIKWTGPFLAGHRGAASHPVLLGRCDEGAWEDMISNDGFTGSRESCSDGAVSIETRALGSLNFSCEIRHNRNENIHEFSVNVFRSNLTLPVCEGRHLPQSISTKSGFLVDIVCKGPDIYFNDDQSQYTSPNTLVLKRINETLQPNITLEDKFIIRQTFNTDSEIAEFTCTSEVTGQTTFCRLVEEIDNVKIGIQTIVNTVARGHDAYFDCLIDTDTEDAVEYKWSFSGGHVPEVSGAASQRLTLINVSLANSGLLVECSASVNHTRIFASALLRVQTRQMPMTFRYTSRLENSLTPSLPETNGAGPQAMSSLAIGAIAAVSALFAAAVVMICIVVMRLPNVKLDISTARAELSWQRAGIYITTLSSSTSARGDGVTDGPSPSMSVTTNKRPRPPSLSLPVYADIDLQSPPLSPITEQDEAATSPPPDEALQHCYHQPQYFLSPTLQTHSTTPCSTSNIKTCTRNDGTNLYANC